MKQTRKQHSAEFKAKVALESLKEQMTLSEIASKYEIHPRMVSRWKEEFLKHSSEVFSTKSSVKEENVDTNELYSKIGRLEMELEWLKKKSKQLGL